MNHSPIDKQYTHTLCG